MRTMCVRRPDGTLELRDELVRAFALTGDVVTDVQHARRARRGREQRVEGRHTPGIGRRNVESSADVVETRLTDPTDTRLQRLQRGQQQVALLSLFSSADRNVRVPHI